MMGGGGGGGMGGMGSMFSAYGQGVKPQGGPSQPSQNQQLQQFRPNQAGPAMAQSVPIQSAQVTPQPQAQPWGIASGWGDDNDMAHGHTAAVGKAAGNAARQSSLQTAISNFHQAQSLGNQSLPQSTQTQGAQRQPTGNLAAMARQLQADTASETAAQNPNTQWASQQPVAPGQIGTMDAAENYVNQNAYTPPNLLDATRGFNG